MANVQRGQNKNRENIMRKMSQGFLYDHCFRPSRKLSVLIALVTTPLSAPRAVQQPIRLRGRREAGVESHKTQSERGGGEITCRGVGLRVSP